MLHFRGEIVKLIYVTRKAMEGTSRNYFAEQSRNWTALPGSCFQGGSLGASDSAEQGAPEFLFMWSSWNILSGFPLSQAPARCVSVTALSSPPPPSPTHTNWEQMFLLFPPRLSRAAACASPLPTPSLSLGASLGLSLLLDC